jgi:hypothetical protein
MNPKRPSALGRAARLTAAVAVALGLVVLTLSRPRVGDDARSAASALAARADQSDAPSAAAVLTELRSRLRHGDNLRIVTVDKRSYGGSLKPGVWTTAVSGLRRRPAGVAEIEVSQPGALAARDSLGRVAAIVSGVIVLLGLVVLSERARGFAGRQPTGRTGVGPPRVPASNVAPLPADGDRRPLVAALMVVVDTLPDSPAGARAVRTLKQVGVQTIEPEPGAAFDSRLHCVCSVVSAPDPSVVDRIAALVRPGYIDQGAVLREADVQVYGGTGNPPHATAAVSSRSPR